MQPFNDERDWFLEKRFGMFIHFGIYAVDGWHEQVRMRQRISKEEYGKRVARFNPVDFNPDAILDLAEEAGMEYLCMGAKHHDGFCMWPSAQTDFNISATPYGKDIIGMVAEACHRRGMPLGIYYSVVDWHQPNYPNQGRHHEISGPNPGDQPDWDAYMQFLKAQVRELCTNYGEISHFFWDMNVPEFVDPSVNDELRKLQPSMVINDRGFDEGDYSTPEREYQSETLDNRAPFQKRVEACNSVGAMSWGYRKDEDYYTQQHLIQSIDKVMTRGGNFLLNIGPDDLGKVPDQAQALLRGIGHWMRNVRPALYDATPDPALVGNPEIYVTRRDNTVYVHFPNPLKMQAATLAPITSLPVKATLLNDGRAVDFTNEVQPSYWQANARYLHLRHLPVEAFPHEVMVVELLFDGEPELSQEGVLKKFEG